MIFDNAFISVYERGVIGRLKYENGTIYIREKDVEPEITITSNFVNSHTHLGDGFIDKVPRLDVKNLVGPGGFKSKMLSSTNKNVIREGIKYSIKIMENENVGAFFDFRESGIEGIKLLENIDFGNVRPFILSRPASSEYNENELEEIIKKSSGIGMSGINDYPFEFLEKVSKYAKKNNKLFSMHVSEGFRENIDDVLKLKPDFIIHMYYGDHEDFEKIIENDIPVIICPSSTLFFKHKFDVEKFKNDKLKIGIGTDNAMITVPSIRMEMRLAWLYFSIDEEKVIEYSTLTMQKFTGKPNKILIFDKKPQRIVKDPYYKPDRILEIKEIIFE